VIVASAAARYYARAALSVAAFASLSKPLERPEFSEIQCWGARLGVLGDGLRRPAHYHPVAEAVTVISSEFSVGMGDKLDMQKGMALHPGGFAYAPAGMRHYGWTTAVVQIDGNGPFWNRLHQPGG
jgi:hypothetical protein